MADVKLNPVFTGFSKQIGDLVFVRRNGGTYVRRKGIPRQPNTEAQVKIRSCFRETAAAWKGLNGEQRQSWEEAARAGNISGYNLFFKVNFPRLRAGEAVTATPADR
ncbi:MAG: hypothetical protein CVV44_20775 [Spirochaetae bacterium HGW-Spirochaetae-1]|jgi:hypothetical protein|nr:MAG: hypothetical protein CVV44_20775 [Spirochaetae bacterium HGW-Spirochaetae-1]